MIGESSSKPVRRILPDHLNVPWGLRDVVLYVLSWVGAQVALAVALILATSAPWGRQLYKALADGNTAAVFGFDLVSAGIGVLLVWRILRKYRVGWRNVGWRRVNILKLVGYVLMVLVAFVVVANVLLLIVAVLVPGFNPGQTQDTGYNVGGSGGNIAFVALVLIPPVLEETIFRGFLFPALAKSWGMVWGAVVSSVLFGLLHGQANIILYTLPLGLVLCWMYVKTKSIVPGIVVHTLNNYLAFVAMASK